MKSYLLKKWYPALPLSYSEGNVITFPKGIHICSNGYKITTSEASAYEFWEPVEPKQPIFTTEDDVDIYEGDKFWIVKDDFSTWSSHGGNTKLPKGKRFSTKEKAQEYIDNNKPRYSKNDIKEAFAKSVAYNDFVYRFWEELDEN